MHGCIGCDKKVWGPDDEETICNFCHGNRYDDDGQAKEKVIWFPLKDRIESLMRCKQYRDAVRFEHTRAKNNSDYITGWFG